jgi:predicted transcriptional regulator of viral defense system
MNFEQLLHLVADQPLFETGLLLSGDVDPNDIRRQLSRWVSSGRLKQLRRGLYTLAPPYQKVSAHPFLIANFLMPGSYVSMQSALAYYGLIPEYAARTWSVTTAHPAQWDGGFHFQHLAPHLFFGYQHVELPQEQSAFIATPEKAILDLTHLTPNADDIDYLRQLRLQNLNQLNLEQLSEFARRAGKPKWRRVADHITRLTQEESAGYEEIP